MENALLNTLYNLSIIVLKECVNMRHLQAVYAFRKLYREKKMKVKSFEFYLCYGIIFNILRKKCALNFLGYVHKVL